MEYYCDIKVLPDPEASEPILISNLFSKLHRALVKLSANDIGVSFPKVGKTLGDTVRLHSTEERLTELFSIDWLKGLRDYCSVQQVNAIPNKVTYRTVSRVQAKSASNKRKRSIAKGWLTEAEALAKISDTQQNRLNLPFVQISSASTKQNHVKLFIKHGRAQVVSVEGKFNCYGLSKTATIPWF